MFYERDWMIGLTLGLSYSLADEPADSSGVNVLYHERWLRTEECLRLASLRQSSPPPHTLMNRLLTLQPCLCPADQC